MAVQLRLSGRRRGPASASAARCSNDHGFTLVEVIVTMALAAVVISSLAAAQVRVLAVLRDARGLDAASRAAVSLIEQARALDWADLAPGLPASGLTGDPWVVAGPRLRVPGTAIDEPLKVHDGDAPPLLSPHRRVVRLAGIDLAAAVYVMPTADADSVLVAAIVQWPGRGGSLRSTVLRTTVTGRMLCPGADGAGPSVASAAATSGCAEAESRARATGATISVRGTDTDRDIPGLGGRGVDLALDPTTTSVDTGPTVTSTATATTSSASAVRSSGSPTLTSGGLTADAASQSGSGPVVQDARAAQSAAPVSIEGDLGALTAVPAVAGGVQSRVQAGGSSRCYGLDGSALASATGCARADAFPSGDDAVVSVALTPVDARWLPSFDLARLAAGGSVRSASLTSGPSGEAAADCPSTGCSIGEVHTSTRALALGKLPVPLAEGDRVPSGFSAAVFIDGWSDRATARSGDGVSATNVGRAGMLTYWDGARYSSVNLGYAGAGALSASASAEIDPPAVTGVYPSGSGDVAITVDPWIGVQPGSTRLAGGDCLAARCEASARTGTVLVRLGYRVLVGGTERTRFEMTVTLPTSEAVAVFRRSL